MLFIMLYLFSLWTKFKNVTIQMKATEQCFLVVLFIMTYKVVQFFVNCYPSNEVIEHNVPVVLFVFMYFFFTSFKLYIVVYNLT